MKRSSLALVSVVTLSASAAFGDTGRARPGPSKIPDGVYKNACGPIACYLALRQVGEAVPLPALARECRWREGAFTTLGDMRRALAARWRVESVPARLTPAQLREFLRSGTYAAVLPVRKHSQEVNHAVCAVGADDERLAYLDYPELEQSVTWDQLGDMWDGQAILVSRSRLGWWADRGAWLILPALASLYLIASGLLRYTPGLRRPAASLALALGLGAWLACAAGRPAAAAPGPDRAAGKAAAPKQAPVTAPQRFDFGTVEPGTVVEHSFKFTNVSSRDLVITGTSVSCGCLSVKSYPKVIRAGAAADIAVRLDTTSQYGRVGPVALLDTADPASRLTTPSIALEVTGVVKNVWCMTDILDFGQLVAGSAAPSVRSVSIRAAGYPGVAVTRVEADFDGLNVVGFTGPGGTPDGGPAPLTRLDRDVIARELRLEWSPKAGPPGQRSGTLVVFTDSKEHPRFEIGLNGSVLGPVRLNPPRIFFGAVAEGETVERTCEVTAAAPGGGYDLSAVRFVPDQESLTVKPVARAGGLRLTLTLRVPRGGRRRVVKGSVEGKAADGTTSFSLPYIAYVK